MGSIHQKYSAFDEAAQKEFAASAKELLHGLWVAHIGAKEIFHANPTIKRWRAVVHTHAVLEVASRAEDDKASDRRSAMPTF